MLYYLHDFKRWRIKSERTVKMGVGKVSGQRQTLLANFLSLTVFAEFSSDFHREVRVFEADVFKLYRRLLCPKSAVYATFTTFFFAFLSEVILRVNTRKQNKNFQLPAGTDTFRSALVFCCAEYRQPLISDSI